ncbi:MAG: D-alanine--D-alanine ligase family protein [Chloroflexota bacterium]
MSRKIRVGILFGGRSGEHEVSIASATSVLRALDPDAYEAVPMGITRDGRWILIDSPEHLLQTGVAPQLDHVQEVLPDVTNHAMVRVGQGGDLDRGHNTVDVMLPLLHGPYGEDGTVQGLFETANIPYVGSGVAGSAVSMDKVLMKQILVAAGLPGVPYRLVSKRQWLSEPDSVVERVGEALAYPVFVKPCNMGSSVGISKAHDHESLVQALNLAITYDRRIIVEQGVEGREVECAVLGNDVPLVSLVGEIVSSHEFYDYEAKYTEGLAELVIPARLSTSQTGTVQEYARRAFEAVDAAGLARVDFFIDEDGEALVNEINTMPGFTQTSMYPKLWEASGIPYTQLINRLIQLALERHEERQTRSVLP